MPAASRSRRSLLVLALVAGLLAATAPIGSSAVLRSETAAVPLGAAAPADVVREDPSTTVDAASVDPTGLAGAGLTLAQRQARAAWVLRTRPSTLGPKAVAVAGASTTSTGGIAGATTYSGRNHVWIPALGISRSISFYSCSSSSYPGNRVYRWGCAGSNNIYLFGHAYSVFKSLHDAYVRGRLAKGMKLYYANASGTVSTYAVSWWKLTKPDKGAWAYAAQSTPSLTLQTCVGAQSQYRLIVRLRKVG
jgi:hypothetical protein